MKVWKEPKREDYDTEEEYQDAEGRFEMDMDMYYESRREDRQLREYENEL